MSQTIYSKDFIPSAPVLPVKLAVPGETQGETIQIALVDTGADGTFIPTAILEEMALPIVFMTNVRSHLGERLHRVPVHMVDIILFNTIRFPNIEVVADDWGNSIIIGRNVINKLNIQLNGPQERLTLVE